MTEKDFWKCFIGETNSPWENSTRETNAETIQEKRIKLKKGGIAAIANSHNQSELVKSPRRSSPQPAIKRPQHRG